VKRAKLEAGQLSYDLDGLRQLVERGVGSTETRDSGGAGFAGAGAET
jgi:hypothetical protein